MSGEKGRRIRRLIWAVDSGARKGASRTHPLRGTPPRTKSLGGECTSRNAAAPTHFGTPISNAMRGAQRAARTTGRHRRAQTLFQTLATPIRPPPATARGSRATGADRNGRSTARNSVRTAPVKRSAQRSKQRPCGRPDSVRNSTRAAPARTGRAPLETALTRRRVNAPDSARNSARVALRRTVCAPLA